jgi:hypothetical protein
VLFTTLLVPGSITGVNVTASGVGGLLNAWLVLSLSKHGNDNVDSDANPTTGRTATFNVISGQAKNDVDAGLYQPAAIGDYVLC